MTLPQHDLNLARLPRWMLDLLEQPTPTREERAAYFSFTSGVRHVRGSEPGSAAPEQRGVPVEAEAEVAREGCRLRDVPITVWYQRVDDRHVQAGLLMEGPEVDLADMPPHLERLELRGVLHLVNSAAPDHTAGGTPSTAVGAAAGCGGAAGGGARDGLALLRVCAVNRYEQEMLRLSVAELRHTGGLPASCRTELRETAGSAAGARLGKDIDSAKA
ncbi:hypothetical protein TSOC_005333 [Tetrabaena socialis]|uniref:Uncharacterized protein n=1 Tax=Tetrabaena socialis TaxID=47790 RepID=A0A2J8A6J0_9CHLO|nr:hypothetical protein TSOC_005333 [Tetrabaena socialis]|eukprot:PNH08138.1 hypothetical protein TSOC_005333 [Tetrabaena socialis]